MEQHQHIERKIIAILATDVVGYSRLMGLDESGTLAHLKSHRNKLFDPLIAEHHGRIVKLIGDGTLVEFGSVVDALACAIAIQRALATEYSGQPDNSRIAYRMGINLGDVIADGDDIYGDGVNVAARLEGLSEPGGIVVSGSAYDHVRNKLEIEFELLGEKRLKNIAEPVRVYKVLLDGRKISSWWGGRRGRLIAAALIPSIALAATVWTWPYTSSFYYRISAEIGAGKPSIAVLPFGNLSEDAEQEYFADGLADDLITDLSKISALFVIARDSSFAFKDHSRDIREIAEELGARYVLQGNVRRQGDSVRINVQLIDTRSGGNIWAERYEGSNAKIFALQDGVTERIVDALAVRLSEGERAQISRLPTRNLEAYDYYLRAEQKVYSVEYRALEDALALYERAIAVDPEFADAYAGYARAMVDVLSFDFQPVMLSAVARQRAYEAAGRALEINPELPRAYSVLGMLQVLDGEFERALASAERAVSYGPNSADAELNLAIVQTYAGKKAEALATMEKLLQHDPRPRMQVREYHAFVLYMNGMYKEALSGLGESQFTERSDFGLEILAMANAKLGDSDKARDAVVHLLRSAPSTNLTQLRVVYGHHKQQTDLDHRLDGMREAGLPEWAYDFRGKPEDRLDGKAIFALADAETWIGHQHSGAAFFMQLAENGEFALRTEGGILVGKFAIKNDALCTRSPAISLGREFCSPIYHNPQGSRKNQDEFVFPTGTDVLRFSVAE